jgi:hypothetical protein
VALWQKQHRFLDALWFCLVIMTVGYGDFYPHTTVTRLLALLFIMVGTTSQ